METPELTEDIRQRRSGVNVPHWERMVSVGAGAAATVIGMRSRSLSGIVLAAGGAALIARGLTGRCPVYRGRAMGRGIEVRRSIHIAAPRREVYQTIRNFSGLSQLVNRIESVDIHDKHVSQWVASIGPMRLQWLAEIVDSEPDRYLSWGTIPGGDLEHLGSIELLDGPGRRGTIVNLDMTVYPPADAWLWPFKSALQVMLSLQVATELMRLRKSIEERVGPEPEPEVFAVDEDAPAEGATHSTQTPPPAAS